MDLAFVDQADGNHPNGDDLIGPVQGDRNEVFLLSVPVMADQGSTSTGQVILRPLVFMD